MGVRSRVCVVGEEKKGRRDGSSVVCGVGGEEKKLKKNGEEKI